MRRLLLLLLCSCMLVGIAHAAGPWTVTYVSAEHVYINGGQSDGLAIGARLLVNGRTELEVVFVAAHSASCTVVGTPGAVQVGDRVELKDLVVLDTMVVADTMPTTEASPAVPPDVTVSPRARRALPDVSGSASFMFFNWNDNTEPNLDFMQSTARVSLKARRLWDREINVSVRGRGRLDKRQRDYRTGIEREDWQNRVWEFSVAYEEPTAPVNLFAGRVLPKRLSGIGYLDGVVVEGLITKAFRAGAFGGSYPEWMYADRDISLMKAGGYVSYTAGAYTGTYFELSTGFVGEYHSGEANREFIISQGRISGKSTWGISHTAEMDVNRGWRKERAGKSFELSNLYLNAWVRPTTRLRFGASYDNRTNYWTFDSRTLVDSLFDDQLRQGVRVQADVSMPAQWFAGGSVGYRNRSGDSDPTWSYSAQLRKANALVSGLTLFGQYSSFDGPANRGYNYAVRANRMFSQRYTLGAGWGAYAYRTNGMPNRRNNTWVEISGQADIGRRYWLGLTVQSDSGDDIDGLRLQSEVGYRF